MTYENVLFRSLNFQHLSTIYHHSDLFSWVLWMLLEGPGDSGLKGFGDTFQESAASFNSIQLLLCNTVLMVVCRGQQRQGHYGWTVTQDTHSLITIQY